MLNLLSLKEARSAKADCIRAIVAKATTEKRDLTDVEQSAFDTGKTEIENIEKNIRNAEFLADMERRMDGTPVGNPDKKFDTECREFSIRKAIASQIPRADDDPYIDSGREREISRELARRSGQKGQGMLCPMTVFEKRAPITTTAPAAGPGSNIIATDYLGAQYIDILRAAMCTQRLGARVLNGLVGNVAIPRLKASATGYWVAENVAITASDVQHEQVTLTPNHCGCLAEYSRNMVLQTSPDIESILRDDFAALLARALDTAAINGAGPDDPVGILNTANVTDVPGGVAGLAPTWANILLTIAGVLNANALQGALGFLTNGKVTSKCSTVLKSSADTSSNFILESPGSNTLAGYPLVVSNLVPSTLVKGASGSVCSALIFGNWSDLLIGYWSAFDLLVNPFESTAYPKGNVQIRGMLTADIAVRQPKSFAKIADLLTT
jgi:HK97 family phage major capsid protein